MTDVRQPWCKSSECGGRTVICDVTAGSLHLRITPYWVKLDMWKAETEIARLPVSVFRVKHNKKRRYVLWERKTAWRRVIVQGQPRRERERERLYIYIYLADMWCLKVKNTDEKSPNNQSVLGSSKASVWVFGCLWCLWSLSRNQMYQCKKLQYSMWMLLLQKKM